MANLSAESQALMLDVAETLSASKLTLGIARLYSQRTRLQANQPGLTTWSEQDWRERLEDAERLIEAAKALESTDRVLARKSLRRSAEILEWLAGTQVSTSAIPVELLSAAAYQLAGYPARALGLRNATQETTTDSPMLMGFLGGRFAEVHDAITARLGAVLEWEADSENHDTSVNRAITVSSLRAMGVLCSWLRWGDESRLPNAIDALESVSRATLYGVDPYSWMLARLVAETAKSYAESSLRHSLVEYSTVLAEQGDRAVERYARMAYQNGTALAWPSQVRGINRLISGDSFALCTPTGSGKTRVAELAILSGLFGAGHADQTPEEVRPIALYLVPSRALAAEVESTMRRALTGMGAGEVTVTSMYGGGDWGPSDALVDLDKHTVLVSTHEKAEAMIRFLGPDVVRRLSLLVLDEAHTVAFKGNPASLRDAESRSLRLEILVSRLVSRMDRRKSRVVALSAVASGFEDRLARWVSFDKHASAEAIAYRSTRQLVGKLVCEKSGSSKIRYDLLDGQRLKVEHGSDDESPYVPKPFPDHPQAASVRNGKEKWMRAHLLWAAMHFAARSAAGEYRSVLISVPQQPGGYGADFLALLEKDWKSAKVPDYFEKPASGWRQATFDRCLRSCADYFGEESREYRLLLRGIALHHGKMPGIMSRLLVELIQHRIVNIALATSTLSEGVNLPFETILIPSLRRAGQYLSTREFANLIGRAGRPGVATEGRALVLLSDLKTPGQRGSREAYRDVVDELASHGLDDTSGKTAIGPLEELLQYIAKEWSHLANSDSVEEFFTWLETAAYDENAPGAEGLLSALDTLDGFLVSEIAERDALHVGAPIDSLEDSLRTLWQRTFSAQATAESEDNERLFVTRGVAVEKTIYPNEDYRSHLYYTGLPPRFGRQVIGSLDLFSELLKEASAYAYWNDEERIGYLARLMQRVRAIQPFSFPDSLNKKTRWQRVLTWWLRPELLDKQPTPASISRWYDFGSHAFTYRFNWGLGTIASGLINRAGRPGSTLERWQGAGLPWGAFWLKDLMTWGVLDPVAAFLLAKGRVETRPEAYARASAYWENLPGTATDAMLDPRAIQDWLFAHDMQELNSRRDKSFQRPLQAIQIPAEPLEDFSVTDRREWRVLPFVSGENVLWLDPAGYPLARSADAEAIQDRASRDWDFVLEVGQNLVSATRYV